jgi:hypothetical protein
VLKYHLKIKTGDPHDAGTDANVHVQLYGTKGKSPEIKLHNKGNSFEKGKLDEFTLETLDLGEPIKIRIGHDNSGLAPGWFVDYLILESPTGRSWTIPCGKWFDKKEDDGQTEREFAISSESGEAKQTFTYKVTVVTGDVRAAGTSAKVSITLYGTKGDSGTRIMHGKFDRGAVSSSDIECVDLGDLTKIRIEVLTSLSL